MTSAGEISFFLTHTASRLNREEMIDLFNFRFTDYEGSDEFYNGLRAGVSILQQEAAMQGEILDVRYALARLAKVSRREVDPDIVLDIASFPTGISTAIH
jgi:hypothetical protein